LKDEGKNYEVLYLSICSGRGIVLSLTVIVTCINSQLFGY
jgi:hypothetical protein